MNEKRIGLDVDGVLANFGQGILNKANELGVGDKFPKNCKDINQWNICENPKDFMQVYDSIKKDEEFWMELEAFEAPNYTPVAYITHRYIPSSVTAKWLEKNNLPKAQVITVNSPEEKIKYLKELNLDVYIDDLYTTVRTAREHGINAVLLRKPYQRGHVEECKDLPTIDSINEVCEYV